MTSKLPNSFKVGEYLVNRSLNSLVINKQEQILEPRVMEVLYYLAARHNQVISIQELMDELWQAPVTKGAVSRVVGLLRKSLADDSDNPRYIQTVAKKGYRLIAEVSHQEEVSSPLRSKISPVFPLAGIVALFAALLIWVMQPQSTPSLVIAQPKFMQLTSDNGFEYDATLSDDENWLLYRHSDGSGGFNLFLKNLEQRTKIQLTNSEQDDRKPAISDDKKRVVFFRKGDNSCSLRMLSLDDAGNPLKDEELYQCGAIEHYSNVTWSADNNSVYFTDRDSPNVPYQILNLDLATKRITQITSDLQNYYGDNELSLSPSGRYLAFFRNKYWGNNEVYVLDLSNGKETKVRELGFLAWNISWTQDEKHLLFSDNRVGGELKQIEISTGVISSLYHSHQQIISPELTNSGTGIIYSTKTADVDLWKTSITSLDSLQGPVKLSLSSSRIDMQPALSRDGASTLFLSDRNGVMQLWVTRNGELSVIESLPFDKTIKTFMWHPQNLSAVVSTADNQLYIVDTKNDTSAHLDLGAQQAMHPYFSIDGSQLYFASDLSGDWQIWFINLDTKTTEQITTGGGYQAKPSLDGKFLFFTKYRQEGIWKKDLSSGSEQQVLTEGKRWMNFSVCEDALLYLTESKVDELWFHDLTDNLRTKLITLPASANMQFDATDKCDDVVFSQSLNIESDVMLLKM